MAKTLLLIHHIKNVKNKLLSLGFVIVPFLIVGISGGNVDNVAHFGGIFVGFLMVSAIVDIDFTNASDAVPAYLCVIAMPLMYSISEGIAIGTISYVLIKLFSGKGKTVKPLMYILAVLFVCKYIFL